MFLCVTWTLWSPIWCKLFFLFFFFQLLRVKACKYIVYLFECHITAHLFETDKIPDMVTEYSELSSSNHIIHPFECEQLSYHPHSLTLWSDIMDIVAYKFIYHLCIRTRIVLEQYWINALTVNQELSRFNHTWLTHWSFSNCHITDTVKWNRQNYQTWWLNKVAYRLLCGGWI